MNIQKLIRPMVRKLHGYVPGEQPKIKGLIKLNTNENPYGPSPKVIRAVQAATDDRLRLYPNPTAQALREKLALLHGCGPENIIVGNGSDELLALAVRAFVEPEAGAPNPSRATVQYFTPSYSLYPVLGACHGARNNPVPLAAEFALPSLAQLRWEKKWDFRAALSLITTPNAPSGRGYQADELEALAQRQKGVVILDEAYVDFAQEDALSLAIGNPNVIIARTFSKAYALCFQRVGYFVAHTQLVTALDTLRDSYNVNGLGQIAALATLEDLGYYKVNFRKVIATRARLTRELTGLGFAVAPSQANFLFVKPPQKPAQEWLELLRERKILVRWFGYPETRDHLRITVGTDAEADALLKAVMSVLRK